MTQRAAKPLASKPRAVKPPAAKPLTIAVTGLNATDSPGPGVPIIRAIRDGAAEAGRAVRIVGLAYEPLDPGLYMPGICDSGYLMPFPSQGDAAVRGRLLAIHAEESIDVLMPALDSELSAFIKMEAELREAGIHTFLPTGDQLKLRSKARFNTLAETHGVRVPRGRTVTDIAELHRLHAELPYPIMIKGQFYEAYLARTPFEAEAYFHKLAAKWGLPVVVQEVIEGDEYDVVAVGDGEGGLIGAVPMRKLQLTDKGKAWGGVTVSDPELDAFSRDTMAQIKWRGPCELEVMRSKRDGKHYLIEVNPRFPAWCYLSVGAGQNLPWAVVRLALGDDPGALPPYRVGTMFLRHSFDQICSMDDYAAITTVGGFRRDDEGGQS